MIYVFSAARSGARIYPACLLSAVIACYPIPPSLQIRAHAEVVVTQTDIGGVSPFFIVRDVPATLAFYRDRLGFEIAFEGPEQDDIFFGIVQRGRAMLMFKDIGVEPVPNCTRDVGKGDARWDAYFYVPDPDALAVEFRSRDVEFHKPLEDTHDGLRGFEIEDIDGYVLFFGRPRE